MRLVSLLYRPSSYYANNESVHLFLSDINLALSVARLIDDAMSACSCGQRPSGPLEKEVTGSDTQQLTDYRKSRVVVRDGRGEIKNIISIQR